MLLLYKSVFVQTMVFNSGVWSRLSTTNFKALETAQLKCLKRFMRCAASTPNCFVYLELGVLPMKYEIHSRQLKFLFHVLTLKSTNPVLRMYQQQLMYPFEPNWATEIEQLKVVYGLPSNDKIASMSKGEWKGTVKRAVRDKAREFLLNEASTKKKLKDLSLTTSSNPSPTSRDTLLRSPKRFSKSGVGLPTCWRIVAHMVIVVCAGKKKKHRNIF